VLMHVLHGGVRSLILLSDLDQSTDGRVVQIEMLRDFNLAVPCR